MTIPDTKVTVTITTNMGIKHTHEFAIPSDEAGQVELFDGLAERISFAFSNQPPGLLTMRNPVAFYNMNHVASLVFTLSVGSSQQALEAQIDKRFGFLAHAKNTDSSNG